MHVTHDERELQMRVRQMRWEALRVLSVELEPVDGTELPPWAAGAHLDLHLPGVITRQYSLCGDLDDRQRWRIAVLREAASQGGSEAVHTTLRPGDEVTVVGPRNNFEWQHSPKQVLIAGGIGITPMLSMAASAEASGSDWRLVYGGRSRASMAFVDELCARYGDRVEIVAQDEQGLLDLTGLLDNPDADTLVYCCGPEALLAAVEERCAAAWPTGALHVERFAAKPRPVSDPEQEREFEVVLQQTGATVTVAPGQSVLDALEANGIDPLYSCREGICGTCETTVLDGLPDHRDSLLSEEEKAANETMMICVGRAFSDRLVLDL